MDAFSPIRLTTVHPALVHFTLGAVPVILVAYWIAAWRGSERWSFAGDAAVWISAVLTIATAAFGFVSNAAVPWPGGIELWRWLHLGFAVAATVALLTLAAVRALAVRRRAVAGRGTFAAAAGVSALLGATGWIGGEVLVFHSGMAVAAAGHGALAPTIRAPDSPPREFAEAMGRLRGAWAHAQTEYARMLVEQPTEAGYARVAVAAAQVEETASWLETEGARAFRHGEEHASGESSGTIAFMAARLAEQARELERAARDRNWSSVTRSLSDMTSTCAGCHQTLRWSK